MTWGPLMAQPGYELGLGLALLHGLAGGPMGLAAVRLARRGALPGPLGAVLAATALGWLALVPAFLVATARTLATTPCSPWATVEFFPLLTLPSVLLAVSVGGALAHRVATPRAQLLAWAGVVLASAAHTAWPLIFGPQVYAYNHLAGYFPGPLYDETLRVMGGLWAFRLGTLLLSAHALAYLARPSSASRALVAASGLAFVGLEAAGPALGFRMDDATLARRLGGVLETKELILHYPADLAPAELRRALEDTRFRLGQLARFFGGAPPGPVTVWWYSSPEQKGRLVGAWHTQFSKPWRREVHVHAQGFPHPTLKHELVHALAAPWGARPFGVAATALGLWPQVGVIEGLAVAADDPADELTLTQWASALRRRGLLPDLQALMTPAGFYAAPASRAYTAAGAFVRWLTTTRGAERTRRLYLDGDFEAAYGEPLAALVADFERFLDGVELDEAALERALPRFRRGSLFERPCAREVAHLAEEAARSPPEAALEALQRCRALQPAEPSHAVALARRLLALGRLDDAAALLDDELRRLEDAPMAWADAALVRVEAADPRGEAQLAQRLLERLLERPAAPAVERTARVRLEALHGSPTQAHAVRLALEGAGAEAVQALRRAGPEGGWATPYLLGRALYREGAFAEASSWLERAADVPGCPAAVAREARRLAVHAAFEVGDCAAVRRLAVTQVATADWPERCEDHAANRTRDGG